MTNRSYHVWTIYNKAKKIIKYIINDITDEEYDKNVKRPDVVEFIVSEAADAPTQLSRAQSVCGLLNGYFQLEITDTGELFKQALHEKKEAKKEQQEAIAIQEAIDIIAKVKNRDYKPANIKFSWKDYIRSVVKRKR